MPTVVPDWDSYFLDIAKIVAKRHTCPAAAVGAVFVDSETKSILTTGYNGSPRGMKHCDRCDGRKIGERSSVCLAVHAETNAIYNATFNGVGLRNATLYCTNSPCDRCVRAVVSVGTRRVVWIDSYPDISAIDYLKEAGIEVCQRIVQI